MLTQSQTTFREATDSSPLSGATLSGVQHRRDFMKSLGVIAAAAVAVGIGSEKLGAAAEPAATDVAPSPHKFPAAVAAFGASAGLGAAAVAPMTLIEGRPYFTEALATAGFAFGTLVGAVKVASYILGGSGGWLPLGIGICGWCTGATIVAALNVMSSSSGTRTVAEQVPERSINSQTHEPHHEYQGLVSHPRNISVDRLRDDPQTAAHIDELRTRRRDGAR